MHVRAVCKEASLRFNREQPTYYTLKSACDLFVPLSFEGPKNLAVVFTKVDQLTRKKNK